MLTNHPKMVQADTEIDVAKLSKKGGVRHSDCWPQTLLIPKALQEQERNPRGRWELYICVCVHGYSWNAVTLRVTHPTLISNVQEQPPCLVSLQGDSDLVAFANKKKQIFQRSETQFYLPFHSRKQKRISKLVKLICLEAITKTHSNTYHEQNGQYKLQASIKHVNTKSPALENENLEMLWPLYTFTRGGAHRNPKTTLPPNNPRPLEGALELALVSTIALESAGRENLKFAARGV